MGQILEAKCKCGYSHDEIFFGGVKSNYKTVCNVPGINIETGQLEVVNLYDHQRAIINKIKPQKWYKKLFGQKRPIDAPSNEIITATYKFYNNTELQSEVSINSNEIRSSNFVMYERDNYCPSCKQFFLNFRPMMFTD